MAGDPDIGPDGTIYFTDAMPRSPAWCSFKMPMICSSDLLRLEKWKAQFYTGSALGAVAYDYCSTLGLHKVSHPGKARPGTTGFAGTGRFGADKGFQEKGDFVFIDAWSSVLDREDRHAVAFIKRNICLLTEFHGVIDEVCEDSPDCKAISYYEHFSTLRQGV